MPAGLLVIHPEHLGASQGSDGATCPTKGTASHGHHMPRSLRADRLLLCFPTANTNGDCSACALACSCGGVPKGRAGVAPLRNKKVGSCPRGTRSSSCLFPPCAVSSLFLSLVATPPGAPPGSLSLLGDCQCQWLRSLQGFSKEQGKQLKQRSAGAKISLSYKVPPGKEAGEEKSKVEHGQHAKAHG